jgi:hypothetical protein
MNRRMFKPKELTTRQTAAAINRLNNALPLFPLGTEASKFSDVEITGLLEWSLPAAWRVKFDLDGYIPTMHPKKRLIEACEAIERNMAIEKESAPASADKAEKKKKVKASNKTKSGERASSSKTFFCSEHGKNTSHATADCFKIKNAKSASDNKRFSAKSFRKEVNLLSKKSSKKKILDLYASAIKKEKEKLSKRSKKRKERELASSDSSGSDSDSEVSVNIVEPPRKKSSEKIASLSKEELLQLLSKKQKRSSPAHNPEIISEEKEYQKKVMWLADRGEADTDEKLKDKEKSSSEEE